MKKTGNSKALLLERIKLREAFKSRGFQWQLCRTCEGFGTPAFHAIAPTTPICLACNGNGGKWQAPITREL